MSKVPAHLDITTKDLFLAFTTKKMHAPSMHPPLIPLLQPQLDHLYPAVAQAQPTMATSSAPLPQSDVLPPLPPRDSNVTAPLVTLGITAFGAVCVYGYYQYWQWQRSRTRRLAALAEARATLAAERRFYLRAAVFVGGTAIGIGIAVSIANSINRGSQYTSTSPSRRLVIDT